MRASGCTGIAERERILATILYEPILRHARRGVGVAVLLACLLIVVSCASASKRGGASAVNSNVTGIARRENVLLLPPLAGGEGGWCMTLHPGECPESRIVRSPIIAEEWYGAGGSADLGTVLTTSNVAYVALDGARSFPTRSEPGLPSRFRVAVVEARGGRLRHVPGFNIYERVLPLRSLHFTPLDSNGHPIQPSLKQGPPLAFGLSSRRFRPSAMGQRGVCKINAARLAGLDAREGFVADHLVPHVSPVEPSFLSCVSVSYRYDDWPLIASVFVDASHPGVTPAPLPDMRSVFGRRGIFQALGVTGEIVARRIRSGWLVVGGGSGLRQRLVVLEHLRAVVGG